MKFKRLVLVVVIATAVIMSSNMINKSSTRHLYTETYPSVLCPAATDTLQVSLTNSSKLVRSVGSTKLAPAKSTVLRTSANSIEVDGEGVNSIAILEKSGSWEGGALCVAPQSSQYFVGGSGDVSSKSRLVLVNSGLSSSTVDITAFTAQNNAIDKPVTVRRNQTVSVSLVSLVPGANETAFLVAPRSGHVSAFLIDERGKGLSSLGGDVVNSQFALHKTIYIPLVPHQQKVNATHILRILNPNMTDANVSAELISTDGRFVPVGLDGVKTSPGRVQDYSFNVNSNFSVFALKITSDIPIAASVYSSVKSTNRRDFVWSTASQNSIGTWAISGSTPFLAVSGDKINTQVRVLMPGGQNINKTLSGNDIVGWQLPANALGIQILRSEKDSSAALLISTSNGTGYVPLVNGSALSRSEVPTANIGVLNP